VGSSLRRVRRAKRDTDVDVDVLTMLTGPYDKAL
jgi:hypothetical protein